MLVYWEYYRKGNWEGCSALVPVFKSKKVNHAKQQNQPTKSAIATVWPAYELRTRSSGKFSPFEKMAAWPRDCGPACHSAISELVPLLKTDHTSPCTRSQGRHLPFLRTVPVYPYSPDNTFSSFTNHTIRLVQYL